MFRLRLCRDQGQIMVTVGGDLGDADAKALRMDGRTTTADVPGQAGGGVVAVGPRGRDIRAVELGERPHIRRWALPGQ